MSQTPPRPRRLGRLAAGLTVAAAATATALLGASPAYAQPNAVEAHMLLGNMIVTGTTSADTLTAEGDATTITLSNTSGSLVAGPGCTQVGADVRCGGVEEIRFAGRAGNDSFFHLAAAMPSGLNGGEGDDKLLGGQGKDDIFGGNGFDQVSGSGGFEDRCVAEQELRCEL